MCNISETTSTDFIDKYTECLNDTVGKNDALIGREREVGQLVKVLSRRKKNNVILTGKAGVGKTSIVYGLASLIESGNVPDILKGKKVVMLNIMSLISGTQLRGMFEERVENLFSELKKSSRYILFIDNMQMVLKSSSKDRDTDLSDVLGNILSEGEVRVIGTIGLKDYRNAIESNAGLARKMQKVVIEPNTEEETLEILKHSKSYYEEYHHVKFSEPCLKKAITLAERYISSTSLPDSAIDVIDLVGATVNIRSNSSGGEIAELKAQANELSAKRFSLLSSGNFENVDEILVEESKIQAKIAELQKFDERHDDNWVNVTDEDVCSVVSEMTNIPINKLNVSDKQNLLNIDSVLKKDIIGQNEAIEEVCKVIKRNRVGLNDKSRCGGVFFFGGRTGCGKTLLAKKLAEHVYGDEKALIRFDMSEYQDKTSVNKLIGASAGYVGYDSGGLLTEAVKNKPYCVLLFDEIEKADESIYNVFLQLFDEGRLTDNNGQIVNFKNTIVVLTSNIGARASSELSKGIAFVSDKEANGRAIVEKALKSKFSPEFLNRIDKIIHFNNLSDENLKKITRLEIDKLTKRMEENGNSVRYSDSVVDYVFNKAVKEKEFGARPIIRIVQESLADKMVDLMLSSEEATTSCFVDCSNDEITVKASS